MKIGGEIMIDEKMIIDDILYKHPKLEEIFKSFGIKCFGWGGAIYMSVEQAAQRYGIKVDGLVKELNEAIAE